MYYFGIWLCTQTVYSQRFLSRGGSYLLPPRVEFWKAPHPSQSPPPTASPPCTGIRMSPRLVPIHISPLSPRHCCTQEKAYEKLSRRGHRGGPPSMPAPGTRQGRVVCRRRPWCRRRHGYKKASPPPRVLPPPNSATACFYSRWTSTLPPRPSPRRCPRHPARHRHLLGRPPLLGIQSSPCRHTL